MKYLLLLLVGLSLTSCNFTESQVIENTKKAVVWVGNSYGHGTGVLVKNPTDNAVILTNAHVCDLVLANGGTPIVSHNGKIITLPVIFSRQNNTTDLCLLEYRGKFVDDYSELELAPRYHSFTRITILGYPLDYPLSISAGFVGIETADPLRDNGTMVSILAPIYPGNSGSPVVDSQGYMIGLVAEGDTRTGFGGAVTLDHIKEFLQGVYAN